MMKKNLTLILLTLAVNCTWAQQSNPKQLDLQQCVDIAIENNLTVRKSLLGVEQAKINLTQAQANYLPTLNLSGNYGYNYGRSIDPTSNSFINQQIGFAGAGGSAGMVLFNWFNITNTVRQRKLQYESSTYDSDKAKNDISLNIATYYLNVIFNQELRDNAEFQLKSSQEQLERTRKMVAAGALPKTNELELISQVATNEVNLINAENNLNLAMLNLKQGMLIPTVEEIEVVIPELDMTGLSGIPSSAEDIFEVALNTMPEIQSANLSVESAIMGVKVAQSGYAPTLSLNGSFRTNYSDAYQTFVLTDKNNPYTIVRDELGNIVTDPTLYQTSEGIAVEQIRVEANGSFQTVAFKEQLNQNLSKSVSLNLSVPIFNNLQAKSSVQRAKISLQQAEIAVLERQNTLRQSIEMAYNDAFAASKTFQASTKQVDALSETFRSVENQYNLGAANFTDYQVASNNLFRAKSDLVRAKYDYIFKLKILDFYQGKTLSL